MKNSIQNGDQQRQPDLFSKAVVESTDSSRGDTSPTGTFAIATDSKSTTVPSKATAELENKHSNMIQAPIYKDLY